ncbi:MAG: class I SAM-dependent methyltransferase [Thermoflexales bacterium]|nr:class I SAM-dependent methyltransferase [Thermoflexales bacterium]
MDDLTRYDRTRERLREALAGQLSPDVDLEWAVTAYAYWVCYDMVRRAADWEETLQEHVALACQDAATEAEAERAEMAALRRALADARGPLLDVGAGWGRLAPLYQERGLDIVYVEPMSLGARLMRRSRFPKVVRSTGEALPFTDGVFVSAVIAWVLHHRPPEVNATGILREVARVMAPGSLLFSIEPLRAEFGPDRWVGLLQGAGFHVRHLECFFEGELAGGMEQQALAVAVRTHPAAKGDGKCA